jgi:hypothetical protein
MLNEFWNLILAKDKDAGRAALVQIEDSIAHSEANDVAMGLSIKELIIVRELCAVVYEEESKVLVDTYAEGAWQSYARYLQVLANIIREQNTKLLPLGLYMEQKGKGTAPVLRGDTLQQLMADYQELGYLLNPLSRDVAVEQVKQTLTARPGMSQFFKDMREEAFSPIREKLSNAINSIVLRCDVLAENGHVVRYFKQHFMPYLVQDIA